jgi:hypothetical protein
MTVPRNSFHFSTGWNSCTVHVSQPGVGKGTERDGGFMHRTMTLDVLVGYEGELELHLDSGKMKLIKAGNCIVQSDYA